MPRQGTTANLKRNCRIDRAPPANRFAKTPPSASRLDLIGNLLPHDGLRIV
jgi:hypothetical protein